MAELEIRAEPEAGRNRLKIYHGGVHIGDYERSTDGHVDAKRREAEAATHLLLDAYERHGKIAVRWNGSSKTKEIRSYQEGAADPGRGGAVLGLIPKTYWTER